MSYENSISASDNPLYQPLNQQLKQIRILILHAARAHGEIQATLDLALLPPRLALPDYEAISYCWGDSTQCKRITLNGLAMLAPASAVNILEQLRPVEGTRRLWIDALCINQADVDERGYQVTLMYDIYKNSLSTIIWLGDDDEGTGHAINLCEEIASRVSGSFGDDGLDSEAQKRSFASLGYSVSDLACLEPIFTSRWFTRQWVFQEAIAASTRSCRVGRFAMSWSTLDVVHAYLAWATSKSSRTRDILDTHDDPLLLWFRERRYIDLPLKIRRFRGAGWLVTQQLSNAMVSTRHLDATDSRDKVYGILSLVPELEAGSSSQTKLYPDYRRSARNLFPEVVRRMINEAPSLLPMVDLDSWPIFPFENDPESWPSWVPRIDRPGLRKEESTWPFYIGYTASQNLAASVKPLGPNDDPDILIVGGFLKDVVSRTVPFHGSDTFPFRVIAEIFYSVLRSAESQEARSVLPLILYGTFIAGRLDGESLKDSGREAYNQFLDMVRHLPATVSELNRRLRNSAEVKVSVEIMNMCHNRCFFFMSSGHFGLGPHNMQRGDVIAILLGFPWPVALRIVDRKFRLVGPCFVYGWMEGEATAKWRNAGGQPEIFKIF